MEFAVFTSWWGKQATPKMQRRAAELRHPVKDSGQANMTPAEAKRWRFLRAHQTNDVHFRHQHAIGNYITDFCAPRQKLIIEVDGTAFGRNIWSRKNMITSVLHSYNPKAIKSCVFGITK
jgi:very-short-patch-repair endonuclease